MMDTSYQKIWWKEVIKTSTKIGLTVGVPVSVITIFILLMLMFSIGDKISVSEIGMRLGAGLLSGVICFIPTFIISLLICIIWKKELIDEMFGN